MRIINKFIRKISQIIIDADKDWGGHNINNPGTVDGVDLSAHAADASAHHTKTGNNEVYGLVSAGLAANRPAAGTADQWYFATDTLVLSRDNGAAWDEMTRGETAIRLAQLSEKAHGSLTGVTPDQHHSRSHDHSLAADGTPVAIAGVPDLPASKVTSGRFPMARMPDMGLNKVMVGQGAGSSPIEEDKPAAAPAYAVGDTLILSADTETNPTATTYTKYKEMVIGHGGALRIKFTTSKFNATTMYARIYRNGVAVGTERVNSGGFTTYSEDIAGWSSGDKVQIYCKVNASNGLLQNFRLYAEKYLEEQVLLD